MAAENCVRCGKELPSFSVGPLVDRCSDCRQIEAERNVVQDSSDAGPAASAAVHVPRPLITYILVGINLAVFAAMVVSGVSATRPTSDQLLRWGADFGPYTFGGQWWRMVSATFVHIGLLHLALNMWCLWNLGALAELLFGRRAFILLYILCGLGGSAASLAWSPTAVSAGASGAVFGVAGALIALFKFAHLRIPPEEMKAQLKSLVAFAGYNLLFGAISPRINNAAHLGGLFTGLLFGTLAAKYLHDRQRRDTATTRAALVCIVLLAVSLLAVQRRQGYIVHLDNGRRAAESKNWDRAIAELNSALAKRPDNPYAHALLGWAYAEKDDRERAEREYRRTLQLQPENVSVKVRLAQLYLKSDRVDEAEELFGQALQRDRRNAEALAGTGFIALSRGDTERAVDFLSRAVTAQRHYPAAYFALGLAYTRAGQREKAIEAMQTAVSQDASLEAAKQVLDALNNEVESKRSTSPRQ